MKRYHVGADLRIRYEGDFFPSGQRQLGRFPQFQRDQYGRAVRQRCQFHRAESAHVHVDQNRNRFRFRARFGAGIDVGQGFSAGLRVGTGQDDSPVTENQTLGLANNGQGGNFSKYAIWLDRAFLRYQLGDSPTRASPPRSAGWIIRSSDRRCSGPPISASTDWLRRGRYKVADGITPFFTAGGFPVFNTDFNFATTSAAKFSSEDKYLFAVQGGTDWALAKDITLKTTARALLLREYRGESLQPVHPAVLLRQRRHGRQPSLVRAERQHLYRAARHHPDASNDFGLINQWQ